MEIKRKIIKGKLVPVSELIEGPLDGKEVCCDLEEVRKRIRQPLICSVIFDNKPLEKPNYRIARYRKISADKYLYDV